MTLEEMLAEEAQLSAAIARINHLTLTEDVPHYGRNVLYFAKIYLEKQRDAIGLAMRAYFADEVTA